MSLVFGRRFRRPFSSLKCKMPDEIIYLRLGHAAFYLDHQYTVILYLYHVKYQITLHDVN